ncbi:LamG domain-containing protein [Streptomyces qinglanensis]|uniref:LamG domain-containing protein n=1 Tax=Streptomyces qinglanensis TaxID=943816 RepID=UPI00379C3D80
MRQRARSRGARHSLAGLLTAAVVCGVVPAVDASAEPADRTVHRASDGTESSGRATTDAALVAAERTGKPVEVTSLRGESRDVYATADGNLEAREYLRPVRARVGRKWQPVDSELTKTADGSVAPKSATVGLEFSGGGDQPLVRMHKADRELALSWPEALPEPKLNGATATYTDVLPDVDLRLGAGPDGFTQLLVVKSPKGAANEQMAKLRLKLAARGMDVRETAEGGLAATDKGARGTVFEAPAPKMWDSSPGASDSSTEQRARTLGTAAPEASNGGASAVATREPRAGESGKLKAVDVEIPDGGNELVLTPDAKMLRASDTKYPVFVDPQWYSPRASAWTMASKYWAGSPQWKFNGDRDAGLGYCNWSYCKPHDTKRLFYRIPVSKFRGKSILSAEFVVRNTWSASCSARSVQLWQTKGISTSTTWKSQSTSGFWRKKLASRSFAHGYSGCAAKDAEFSVKSAVQSAADSRAGTMTFGLRAGSESDGYAWKRFSDRAYLRAKYNRPPTQIKMKQLTMQYGGVCKRPDGKARVRTLGKIYANDVRDPDRDSVSVQFQAKWDTGDGKGTIARWKPARTSAKKSGSNFAISLPKSIPENRTVHWYARVYDGAQYSPWSYAGDPTGCYFVRDTKVPEAPAISSGDYPESDPGDARDPWFDGVGRYGTFRLKAADNDVSAYRYGINSDPVAKHKATTADGAARDVHVLPGEPGINFLTAQAFDEAGNGSEVRTYQYRVKPGQPARATWQLDEGEGADDAKGSTPPRSAKLHGGATPGANGIRGSAVAFNGADGYAATDIPVVDTSRGFAVSAWVNPARTPDHAAVIATQPGNHTPGFELYYSKVYDRWAFNQYKSDAADAGIARVMGDKPDGVQADKWTHLVGSYDSVRDVLELYVDGKLVGETHYSDPWEARRGLQIGAGSYDGSPAAFFPGAVDEVQLFDKPLSSGEVTTLHDLKKVGDPGRPSVAVFGMDEKSEATELTGHADVLPAKYTGGVATGVTGVAGKAAVFDGQDDYARVGQSSGPHVNTSRSFTISAWARLQKKPDHAAIITAQAGRDRPGFELYYSSAYDRWAVNQYSSDSPDAHPVRAMQPSGVTAHIGEWVHLVGVHDTVADTLTLYVNGTEAGSTKLAGAFYADRSMYLGAGSYSGEVTNHFPGTLDDIRLLDRSVSAEEARQMFMQRPLVRGRWNFEKTEGENPRTSPDDSAGKRPLTLHGDSQLGPGMVDNSGLQLNGTDTYASTESMPIDTKGSFTVTAWAQTAALPEHPVSLLSAEGENRSAFDLRFVPDDGEPEGLGRWELTMPGKDSTGATVVRLSNTEFSDAREWNHLAVSYDGFTKQVRLYVNGVLQEIPCEDVDGDGEFEDADCDSHTSWSDNALSFTARKSLQVGRVKTSGTSGSYFPGTVDDVWAFQGALSDSQVSWLAGQWFDVPTDVPDVT